MTPDDGIRIQFEISKRTRLFLLLNCIRRNIRSHDKKEDKKRNTIDRRNKINIKKRRTRKSYIRISKKNNKYF